MTSRIRVRPRLKAWRVRAIWVIPARRSAGGRAAQRTRMRDQADIVATRPRAGAHVTTCAARPAWAVSSTISRSRAMQHASRTATASSSLTRPATVSGSCSWCRARIRYPGPAVFRPCDGRKHNGRRRPRKAPAPGSRERFPHRPRGSKSPGSNSTRRWPRDGVPPTFDLVHHLILDLRRVQRVEKSPARSAGAVTCFGHGFRHRADTAVPGAARIAAAAQLAGVGRPRGQGREVHRPVRALIGRGRVSTRDTVPSRGRASPGKRPGPRPLRPYRRPAGSPPPRRPAAPPGRRRPG